MSGIRIDDATREAAVAAANSPTRETSIALLATAAAASFGPFAGLAVRLGANAAIDAIAARRGKRASELSDAEVRLTAAELLSEDTFEEKAEAARLKAESDDSGDDGS